MHGICDILILIINYDVFFFIHTPINFIKLLHGTNNINLGTCVKQAFTSVLFYFIDGTPVKLCLRARNDNVFLAMLRVSKY